MKKGYIIQERIEHKWFFFSRRIVYDIVYNRQIEEWNEDGLGYYLPTIRKEIICSFNTREDAKYFKKLICTK